MNRLTNIKEFLERFEYFKDGEIRLSKIISPTNIKVVLTAQDKAREFDWVSINLEFYGVIDAKLVDENRLSFIDMQDGITFARDKDRVIFGIGKYSNVDSIKNSLFYIECSDVKYKENQF